MAIPGRVTPAEVAKIVDVDEEADLNEYIDFANELVTEVCAAAVKTVAGVEVPFHSSSRLKVIEKWLSAHAYCIFDARAERERVGPISFEAQHKVDLCLDVTHYGQQAKLLDTSGGLARLDEIAKGNIKLSLVIGRILWLGTKPEELPAVTGEEL